MRKLRRSKPTEGGKKKRFKLKISIFYVAMIGVMCALGQGYEAIVYTAAMAIHELAHAEVASRLGYALVSFRLMPYGASLTGSFEGARNKDEFLIAAAGPLCSLLIAVPAVALWWLIPASYYITRLFVSANIFIALFNLLPVFPLDGGRMLLAVLSRTRPRNQVYKIIRILGFVFAALLAVFFVLSLFIKVNFSFALVAAFMFASSIIPDKNSYYQRLYSMAFRTEKLKKGLPVREVMVAEGSTVLALTKMLSGAYYTRFIVVGADLKPKATITETDLESLNLMPDQCVLDSQKLPQKSLNKSNK